MKTDQKKHQIANSHKKNMQDLVNLTALVDLNGNTNTFDLFVVLFFWFKIKLRMEPFLNVC